MGKSPGETHLDVHNVGASTTEGSRDYTVYTCHYRQGHSTWCQTRQSHQRDNTQSLRHAASTNNTDTGQGFPALQPVARSLLPTHNKPRQSFLEGSKQRSKQACARHTAMLNKSQTSSSTRTFGRMLLRTSSADKVGKSKISMALCH